MRQERSLWDGSLQVAGRVGAPTEIKPMNFAHAHLILVHLPIVGIPLAALVLAAGLKTKQNSSSALAHLLIFGLSLTAIAAFLTGGEAEELVEHLPGISERLIEDHEEIAELTLWIVSAAGLVSLASLGAYIRRNTALFLTASRVALVASLVATGFLAKTGYDGGKIRHPEAHEASAAPASEAEAEGEEDGD
jgi:uncharacterized membrane protein